MDKHVVIDVEADGPVPGIDMYSMVSFGAVLVEPGFEKNFYSQVKPISENWIPEKLAISGFTREQHLQFSDPAPIMTSFRVWLEGLREQPKDRIILMSDNPAFDAMWINYYLHKFAGDSPFGWSGRKIGDLWAGYQMDIRKSSSWKKLRITPHSHHALEDAQGVAEALLEFGPLINMKFE